LLIDPDKQEPETAAETARAAASAGADGLLVGGSFLFSDSLHQTVRAIKAAVDCPVLLFPGVSGAAAQITAQADALLLLSLVSGRNAEYLIGEQVRSALHIDRCGLETIPTAYLLVESGGGSSAEFLSGTRPIPRDKAQIAMVHALAAQQLGMKLIYLEAGSGARRPVPETMIRQVSQGVRLPVLVGGGIRDADTARRKVDAGARAVVIGTAVEERRDPRFLRELAAAIHRAEDV
jgi:phosphoglycerol geranylgeranyltransferase